MSAPFIFDTGEDSFSGAVLDASHVRPVLVDFWADWCAPCRVLTPVLESVVRDYAGSVSLAKVEVDENMRLAGRYQLRGFPTVILFQGGVERARFSGAKPANFVRDFIGDHIDDHLSNVPRDTGA